MGPTIVYFFNLNPVYRNQLLLFNNFNHPQRDESISFSMKHVIAVLNVSIGFTQCGLILWWRTNHFIIDLINLLIRELNNCSLADNLKVERYLLGKLKFNCSSMSYQATEGSAVK